LRALLAIRSKKKTAKGKQKCHEFMREDINVFAPLTLFLPFAFFFLDRIARRPGGA
jgi:hypothetical protein